MSRFKDNNGLHYSFHASEDSGGNIRGFVRSNRFGYECRPLTISNDMPSGSAGEGRSNDAPEASDDDDDDGGDGDSDPARSRQHSHPSQKPAHCSASKKHSVLSRTLRQPAEKSQEFNVIGVTEFYMAERLGMSVEFMRKDRRGKKQIPFWRLGTSIRYNPQRVLEALSQLEEGGQQPKPRAKKSVNSLVAG